MTLSSSSNGVRGDDQSSAPLMAITLIVGHQHRRTRSRLSSIIIVAITIMLIIDRQRRRTRSR